MRKYVFLFLCWLGALLAAHGQTTPTITLSTDLAVGSSISLAVKTPAAATIQVDFGNGTLVSKSVTTSATTITGTLVGSQTVKVYGATINYFDCKNSQVTALDVSKATALVTLYCGSNRLSTLDVSSLTKLYGLQCYGNQLKTLDVTKNTALAMLDCENNLFTSIDISKNTDLWQLFCRKNFLTLASLPLPSSRAWTNYSYAAQKPVAIADSITIGDTVNLASQATVGTVATVYTWKTKTGTALVAGTDYTIAGGKAVFLKPQTDSVYCEMTNTAFPNFTGTLVLKTNLVAVHEILPTISFTTEKAIGTEITFALAATLANTKIKVDFGDGVKVEKTIGTTETTITGSIVGSQALKIYGDSITIFTCKYNELTALDITNCSKLIRLTATTNKLSKLDVSKNTKLQALLIENNLLTTIDIHNNPLLSLFHCELNLLETLNISQNTELQNFTCSDNKLTTLLTSLNSKLNLLSCDNNPLAELDISQNLLLRYLNANNNKISSIDLSKNTALLDVYLSNNFLTTIDISKNPKIQKLDLRKNHFTFASLPLVATTVSYNYSPQNKLTIPTIISTETPIDLSAQYSIDGRNTVYTWKTKAGLVLLAGTDYTITEGKTTFLKGQTDSVYCEMTNATFQFFLGPTALTTTNMAVIAPAITMTTEKATGDRIGMILFSTKSQNINIDFGDGELKPFTINNTASQIEGTVAGTKKIQIFGSNISVLNCGGQQLTSLDISNCLSLIKLDCNSNKLTNLDVSKNINLEELSCYLNNFSFSTLIPTPLSWRSHFYAPQKPIVIADKTTLAKSIDLSTQYLVGSKATAYTWKTKSGVFLVEGTDYTFDEGKITFIKGQTDSVYCVMTNMVFPDLSGTYALKTTLTKVEGKPKQTQTISFPSLPATLEVGKTYELSATASSKLPVTFSSSNEALASISGSTLTVLHSGTFSITATQAGNDTLAAIESVQTCTVAMPLLMTLTQTKTATSKFYVTFKAKQIVPNSNTITVTFNGNNPMVMNYTSGYFNSGVGTCDTIRIYGDDVTTISCTDNALTSVKIEPNTSLDTLILSNNQLATLYVRGCANLLSLQCSGNQLTSLDLASMKKLTDLRCSRNKLETLDLSDNTLLSHINAESNILVSINISTCSVLKKLYLYQNNLTTLDVSNNTNLGVLGCHYNKLTIATLPGESSKFTQYVYLPQADIPLAQSVGINQVVDLSSQSTRNGVSSSYVWKTKTGTTLVEGTDYTITGGKTTFLKAQTDSVYCEMTNAVFKKYSNTYLIKTTLVKVTEKPLVAQTISFTALPATLEFGKSYELAATASSKLSVTFSSSDDAIASISGSTLTVNKIGSFTITATQAGNDTLATASSQQTLTATVGEPNIVMTTEKAVGKDFVFYMSTANSTVYVDFGNGTLVEQNVGTSSTTVSGKLVGSSVVKVYGNTISYLNCASLLLTSLDITNCNTLGNLDCRYNKLTTIDLSTCISLKEINCSNNTVTTLDVSKNNTLKYLACYENLLTSLNVSNNTQLTYLACSSNKLTALDISKNTALVELFCPYNQISKLDVSNNTLLECLYCVDNRLISLDISKNVNLKTLICNKNSMVFSTLPSKGANWNTYEYIHQDSLVIFKDIAVGSVLDLSSEYSVGGNTTVYTWISTSGDTLVAGIDYTISEGKTTFLRTRTDSVYCAMTNATFPGFSGGYALKTTAIRILEKQSISFTALPTNVEVGKTYQLSATASTGAAVTFTSSDPSVASVSGTTLTIHKAGSVTISATVAATETLASAETKQTLSIAPVTEEGSIEYSGLILYPTVAAEGVYLRGEALPQATGVSVFNANGQLVLQGSLQQGRLDVSALPAGQYLLKTNSAADQQTHRFVKQ